MSLSHRNRQKKCGSRKQVRKKRYFFMKYCTIINSEIKEALHSTKIANFLRGRENGKQAIYLPV